jgi:hypothetical protein
VRLSWPCTPKLISTFGAKPTSQPAELLKQAMEEDPELEKSEGLLKQI